MSMRPIDAARAAPFETTQDQEKARKHLVELLEVHRRNLDFLELQAAKYGGLELPLRVLNSLDEEYREIARIEAQLNELIKSGHLARSAPWQPAYTVDVADWARAGGCNDLLWLRLADRHLVTPHRTGRDWQDASGPAGRCRSPGRLRRWRLVYRAGTDQRLGAWCYRRSPRCLVCPRAATSR